MSATTLDWNLRANSSSALWPRVDGFGLRRNGCLLPESYDPDDNSADAGLSPAAGPSPNSALVTAALDVSNATMTVTLSMPAPTDADGFWVEVYGAGGVDAACYMVEAAYPADNPGDGAWRPVAASAGGWTWGGGRALLPGRRPAPRARQKGFVIMDIKVVTALTSPSDRQNQNRHVSRRSLTPRLSLRSQAPRAKALRTLLKCVHSLCGPTWH
jgi:hypothetical protein